MRARLIPEARKSRPGSITEAFPKHPATLIVPNRVPARALPGGPGDIFAEMLRQRGENGQDPIESYCP